ncbi:cytochrome P450 [Sphingobium sp. S6]|nr:cytochrome P450 [Sphingobium sp. S6]CAD7341723.1 Cytochrome P450 116 [Sphingobium sp. S6]CAD7341939.1 Cytochrome P450 116 [Sphingobium sp. S8]
MTSETTSGEQRPERRCPVAHDFDPFEGMPHAFFADARRDRPVFFHEGLNAYVLTRYEDCRALLTDTSGRVSARPAVMQHLNVAPSPAAMKIIADAGFPRVPGLVDVDGAVHQLNRRVTQAPFAPARIKYLEDFVREQTNMRLDAVLGAGEADIVDTVLYDIPAAVIMRMMGLPDQEVEQIRAFRGPWATFVWGRPDESLQIDTANAMVKFYQWAHRVTQQRLDAPGDDLISEVRRNADTLDPDGWPRERLDSFTLNMVMAGHETTANTAAYGMVALLSHLDQWQALTDDPSLIPNAVEEVLRYCTGVPTWRQRVVEELTFSGVTIPAGSLVYAALNSANRDEAIFGDDAERFDIRRPAARKNLTFGTGPHTCLGNNLARLELKVILQELSRRVPSLRLVPDQHYAFPANTSQRGPEQVFVTWDVPAGAARLAMAS